MTIGFFGHWVGAWSVTGSPEKEFMAWIPGEWFGGIYYLDRDGFSFNEGGGPFNLHVSWKRGERMFYAAIRFPVNRWHRYCWLNGKTVAA